MADLHILRTHSLSLGEFRKIALALGEQAEKEFGMHCAYLQGEDEDELSFTGPGVKGLLWATHGHLEIELELAFFYGPSNPKLKKKS